MTMNFNQLPIFTKEFERLARKYRSLADDLNEFKSVITVVPLGNGKHFNIITKNEFCAVIKARLFCRYLKGASLRIVYAYHGRNNIIDFIEIYFKGDKENEDHARIKDYLKGVG